MNWPKPSKDFSRTFQPITDSSNTLTESGKGSTAAAQDLTKAYQELAAKNVKNLTAAMEALAAIKKPAEFMELQQRLIKDGVDAAVSDGRHIAQLTSAVFTAAFEPVKRQIEAAQKTAQTYARISIQSPILFFKPRFVIKGRLSLVEAAALSREQRRDTATIKNVRISDDVLIAAETNATASRSDSVARLLLLEDDIALLETRTTPFSSERPLWTFDYHGARLPRETATGHYFRFVRSSRSPLYA